MKKIGSWMDWRDWRFVVTFCYWSLMFALTAFPIPFGLYYGLF
jgi:hypothetical protein